MLPQAGAPPLPRPFSASLFHSPFGSHITPNETPRVSQEIIERPSCKISASFGKTNLHMHKTHTPTPFPNVP